MEPSAASEREYVIEILVFVSAPDAKAVDRMAADAKRAVERTNYRVRDGASMSSHDPAAAYVPPCRCVIATDAPVAETLDACIEIAKRIEQGHVRWTDATTLLAHLRVLREDLSLTDQEDD